MNRGLGGWWETLYGARQGPLSLDVAAVACKPVGHSDAVTFVTYRTHYGWDSVEMSPARVP